MHNLLSVLTLSIERYCLNFSNNGFDITLDGVLIGHISLLDNLFKLDLDNVFLSSSSSSLSCVANANVDSVTWHARLGHIKKDKMTRLTRKGLLSPLVNVILPVCEPCLAGKACRKLFGKARRANEPLELVHSDICGPMSVKARHGASYFLTFINNHLRYGHVYLIAHSYKALDYFKRYLAEVENQLSKSLKTLRTDRGCEYLSDQFRKLCEEKGIRRQLTIPYTPQ